MQIVNERTDLHLKRVKYAECMLKGLLELDILTDVESASLSAVATVMEAIVWDNVHWEDQQPGRQRLVSDTPRHLVHAV